jgi:hypothetical protein
LLQFGFISKHQDKITVLKDKLNPALKQKDSFVSDCFGSEKPKKKEKFCRPPCSCNHPNKFRIGTPKFLPVIARQESCDFVKMPCTRRVSSDPSGGEKSEED